jgi:hypothetical protein
MQKWHYQPHCVSHFIRTRPRSQLPLNVTCLQSGSLYEYISHRLEISFTQTYALINTLPSMLLNTILWSLWTGLLQKLLYLLSNVTEFWEHTKLVTKSLGRWVWQYSLERQWWWWWWWWLPTSNIVEWSEQIGRRRRSGQIIIIIIIIINILNSRSFIRPVCL